MPPSAPRLLRLGAAVALAAAAAGCGGAFDPRAEADVYFTLWGYLDASADTQWVRVSPVRETVDPATGPLDADVVLERVATGEGTALRDSVFTYENGLAAHNYWTTAPVEPGETYRLRVRRSDGAETVATVRVPPAYPAPTLGDGRCQCPATVAVSGVERLVDVQTRYRFTTADGAPAAFTFSKARDVEDGPDGTFIARLYFGDDALQMGIDPVAVGAVQATVLVAGGTADWPDARTLTPETAVLPAPSPQITNGLGFVGGAVTVALPFQPGVGFCPPPGGSGPAEPCLSGQ